MGQAARCIGLHGVSAMLCKFSMLRRKEVINLCDGCRLGCVGDLDVQVPEGAVKGIIVFGPCRFFGLFGRGEDFYVPWDCIQKFGDDIILIDKPFQKRQPPPPPHRKKGWFG
jgi:YlmC/YmxH family sporulation protein